MKKRNRQLKISLNLYFSEVNLPPNPPQKAMPGAAVKVQIEADRSKIDAPTRN
jgi:hypothetical protein